MKRLLDISIYSLLLILTFGCANTCDTSNIDFDKLNGLKRSLYSSGALGGLVVPNPIDATQNAGATATSSQTRSAYQAFQLSSLIDPRKLENDFLKVRINLPGDDASKLAKPDSQGRFVFNLTDTHYSEVMAYYSVQTMLEYVENLGFSVDRSRPLYVMVRAQNPSNPSDINAIYDHNTDNPSMPRTIRLFGDGQFAPGMDRDMYWHEVGHLINESINRKRIDDAGDRAAMFTEAAALHECLADYIAESAGNKGHIGTWLARNFSDIEPGEALRSAVDTNGRLMFDQVSINDGRGNNPERYRMAEWCSRVLWDIRSHYVKLDAKNGGVISDRVILSAVSLLEKNTSIRQFRASLLKAEGQLTCGTAKEAIDTAFASRGFVENFPSISKGVQISASAVRNGSTLSFVVSLSNPNSQIARNVKVQLEAPEGKFFPSTYMQGYGDMSANSSFKVGGSNALGSDYSVTGELHNSASGQIVKYRLRVTVDNGPETILDGQVTL